ncbi:hypothetical protein RUND412_009223, partial [Rhizina undulata]
MSSNSTAAQYDLDEFREDERFEIFTTALYQHEELQEQRLRTLRIRALDIDPRPP